MDFATLIGLIAGTLIVAIAILSGSDPAIFVNAPGLLIVLGGTFSATLIKFPLADCTKSFSLAVKKAFWAETDTPEGLIVEVNAMADLVRKKSLLALESYEIKNPFLNIGARLCVDGRKPEFIRRVLAKEMEHSIERHLLGERIFRGMGESAPAFGMIGTLVGLVQMLSNMQDPSSIGPSMAVALLTTFYGALFANLAANPIADKLRIRSEKEYLHKSLIIESVLSIQKGENPRLMHELLEAFIPTNLRSALVTSDYEGVERRKNDRRSGEPNNE